MKWKFQTGSRFLYQTAALQGDVLYAKNEAEGLYALNAATGALKWKYASLDAYANTSPAVAGDRVIIADTGSVKAIDAISGTLAWKFEPSQAGFPVQFYYGAPAVFSGTVYIHALHNTTPPGLDSQVFAIDLETGELLWRKAIPDHIESTIAIARGLLFFGANDNKVYGLDAQTGAEVWSYTTNYKVRSFPAIAGNKLIIASDDRKLYTFQFN